MPNNSTTRLEFYPLTIDRWADFEKLFGERGACGGCWCMWWKMKNSDFQAQKGEGNKQEMRKVVQSGTVPGILAYADGEPVGWCAVEPREHYDRLSRSRILKEVDDLPVWSVVCFFVEKKRRHQGVTIALLKAAIDYVRQREGKILEGYPVEPKQDTMPAVFAYTGIASAFLQAGFKECARRSDTRPIMRYYVDES